MGNRAKPLVLSEDPEHLYKFKVIAFGWPGSGKTQFSASFQADPRTAPLLLLSASGNPYEVLAKHPDMIVWEMTCSADIDPAFEFLASGQPARHKFRDMLDIPPDLIFKSVAIDTLTDLQLMKLLELLGVQEKRGKTGPDGAPIAVYSAEYIREISKTVPIKPAMWGDVLHFTTAVAQGFISKLPTLNTIVTLQKHKKVDFAGGGQPEVEPWLVGASSGVVPGWVSLVMEFQNRTPVGTAKGKVFWPDGTLVEGDAPYGKISRDTTDGVTKCQIPGIKLGAGIWVPTATKLLNLLYAKKDA